MCLVFKTDDWRSGWQLFLYPYLISETRTFRTLTPPVSNISWIFPQHMSYYETCAWLFMYISKFLPVESFINLSRVHNLRHIFIKDISKKIVEGLVRGALIIRNLIILEINSVIFKCLFWSVSKNIQNLNSISPKILPPKSGFHQNLIIQRLHVVKHSFKLVRSG